MGRAGEILVEPAVHRGVGALDPGLGAESSGRVSALGRWSLAERADPAAWERLGWRWESRAWRPLCQWL